MASLGFRRMVIRRGCFITGGEGRRILSHLKDVEPPTDGHWPIDNDLRDRDLVKLIHLLSSDGFLITEIINGERVYIANKKGCFP